MTPEKSEQIIVDAHVHVYPCYDAAVALWALMDNLTAIGPGAVKTALLAERFDCHFFQTLAEGRAEGLPSDLKVQGGADPEVMVITNPESSEKLFLFSGRQVVTAERIEVLASLSDAPIDDGLSVEKVIDKVLDNGGVPIVSWAPGKWLFKRHEVVAHLLARYSPGQLLLGDTTLRPVGSQQPRLMKKGEAIGFGLVAGSDPLPFTGEERRLGSYATLIEGSFQRALPVSSMRNLFRSTPLKSRFVGRRNHHFEAGQRLVNNMIVKRQGSSRPSKGLILSLIHI